MGIEDREIRGMYHTLESGGRDTGRNTRYGLWGYDYERFFWSVPEVLPDERCGDTMLLGTYDTGGIIVGVMLVSRSGNAVPRGVETYLTDCFVAVYVGTLLSRNRRFNVIGTIVGALFVGFLSNFFTLIGFGAAMKNLFNGIFIILAVALSVLQGSRK